MVARAAGHSSRWVGVVPTCPRRQDVGRLSAPRSASPTTTATSTSRSTASTTSPIRIRTTVSKRDNAFSDDWIAISLDSERHRPDGLSPLLEPERQPDGRTGHRRRPGEQFDADFVLVQCGEGHRRRLRGGGPRSRCRRCAFPAPTRCGWAWSSCRKVSRIGHLLLLARDAPR